MKTRKNSHFPDKVTIVFVFGYGSTDYLEATTGRCDDFRLQLEYIEHIC
jgi:hypothetical protein